MPKANHTLPQYQLEFNERFAKMLEALYLHSSLDLARLLSLPHAEVKSWLVSSRNLPHEKCLVLEEKTGISHMWLLFGKGEMYLPVVEEQSITDELIEEVLKSPEINDWLASKLFPNSTQPYRLALQDDQTAPVSPAEQRQALALYAAAAIAAPHSFGRWLPVQAARAFQWLGLKFLMASYRLL